MMITAETLRRFAPRIQDPKVHASVLERARRTSSVNTPRRLCHFMGQIFVETGGLTRMVENLNYRDPQRLDGLFSAVRGLEDARNLIRLGPEAIANRVYANRLGNGSESSGDGWRYRGSGYKQLTGRSNFRQIGQLISLDIERNPELARDPSSAAQIAFKFWDTRQCSPFADVGNVEKVTELINGRAKVGLADRRAATLCALGIWRE